MGAHLYWYFAEYQTDLKTTLQTLREREFRAGRYNPVTPFIDFLDLDSATSGSKHSSIKEALEASDAEGTRSILDISEISDLTYLEALEQSTQGGIDLYCTTFSLSNSELIELFGTDKPNCQALELAIDELCEDIDRGTARHIFVYKNNEPTEVFFIGYSFD